MELSNKLYDEMLEVLKNSITIEPLEDKRKILVDLMVEYIRYPFERNLGGHRISYEAYTKIMSHVERDEKIKAIKETRIATGLGLKESKEIIDVYLPPKEYL